MMYNCIYMKFQKTQNCRGCSSLMAKGERHKKTRIFRIHDRTFLYQDMGVAAKELMLLNCGVGEDSCESLGLQGDPTSPF